MKLQIGETTYEMARVGQAHLSDLIALKRDTGLTPEDMQAMLEKLDEDSKRDPVAALEGDGALLTMGLIVWLARRRAGEKLTLEDACDFPVTELRIIVEPGDEPPPKPRPTRARPASGPGASRGQSARKATTSKRPSKRA